ncbi:hypothetical protein GJ496_011967 [Pomphorhynchus laevis]|nr:hypothetical protein GJ496_011967 [Pomphorhynchus laevis]
MSMDDLQLDYNGDSNEDVYFITCPYKAEKINYDFTFTNLWPICESLIRAIHRNELVEFFQKNRLSNSIAVSPATFRDAVNSLCTQSINDNRLLILNAIRETIRSQLTKLAAEVNSVNWSQMHSVNLLFRVNHIWKRHREEMETINQFFSQLIDPLSEYEEESTSLINVGLNAFRDLVLLENKLFQDSIQNAILNIIQDERSLGFYDFRDLIREILGMLKYLQHYEEIFVKPFLQSTITFYESEAPTLIHKLSGKDYIDHVERRIQEEIQRGKDYNSIPVSEIVVKFAVHIFVKDRIDFIIQYNLYNLIDFEHFEQLKLLNKYIETKEQAVEDIRQAFSNYIKETGMTIVSNPDQDEFMVERLLTFYNTIENVVECFGNQEKFTHIMRDSYAYFLNSRPNKPSELIAKYIDRKLRSGKKKSSMECIENDLNRSFLLFRLISGKDVFEAFYKKDFAKRLLTGKSISIDAEKSMLSKLKQECGALFTHRLEGMLKDMEVSRELVSSFEQSSYNDVNFPMTVHVLTLLYWPIFPNVNLNVPAPLIKCQESFAAFYNIKHSGKSLQWQLSLCQCILQYQCRPKVYKELQVSLFQTAVLLLFNDADSFTFTNIEALTSIDRCYLERILSSLCGYNLQILIKSTDKINESTVFSINQNFTHRLYRIRVNQTQTKETLEEDEETVKHVIQDRQFQIDAAIVRIMKAKRTLSHEDLVKELFSVLTFSTTVDEVGKRIESLLERDYLSKCNDNAEVYIYVA